MLTDEEKESYKSLIDEAEHALMKQISSSLPHGDYGMIELLINEKKEYDKFLTKMMNKRIARLNKLLNGNKKFKEADNKSIYEKRGLRNFDN